MTLGTSKTLISAKTFIDVKIQDFRYEDGLQIVLGLLLGALGDLLGDLLGLQSDPEGLTRIDPLALRAPKRAATL